MDESQSGQAKMKETLLLVDDEEGIRKVLGISLADIGYHVLTAENGEQALRIFQETNPSIVLTDIKMPGMDGIELLQKIKRESPDTEVIMITGHGDMDLAIKSLKYEAVDFVTKPINDDVLDIALKRAHEKIFMRKKLREYTENLEGLVREKTAKLIKAERQIAVGQAVEGLSLAMRNIAGDFEGDIKYFNEMPCFVSIHSRDLKIVAINQLYKERLGDRQGQSSHAIYRDDMADRSTCPAAKTFNSGKGQRTNAIVEYLDGQEVPVIVHTAPIRNKDHQVELVVEISADITEINRLQEELRNTQQRYQQLFDEVPCYITVQDKELKIDAANKLFKKDFDFQRGSFCFETYKKRAEPCQDCPVVKTFEDGKPHQTEMVVTSKTGQQHNLLIWTAPLRDATGKITKVMEMATNITPVRKLQDHLSSLGLKIGSISHGIKTLLTGLDGGMYMVDTGLVKGSQDRIQEGWEMISIVIERIKKLVLEILFFAKERELKREQTDVLSFANDVASSFKPKVPDQDIEFISRFDNVLGEFELDAGAIRIALLNILENALDACMDDHSQKPHQIIFDVKQPQDYLLVEISDNGVGMDQETKDNLFSLFFSSKGSKGTGLGLFISNKIIEQHGGRIAIKSEPNQGARFTIKIPRKFQPQSLEYQLNSD